MLLQGAVSFRCALLRSAATIKRGLASRAARLAWDHPHPLHFECEDDTTSPPARRITPSKPNYQYWAVAYGCETGLFTEYVFQFEFIWFVFRFLMSPLALIPTAPG